MWNERYSQADYVYGEKPNDFLVEQAARLPKKGAVLELGAGEGRNGVWLAQQGHAVTSLDSSDVGLKKAEALAKARGVALSTVVADLSSYVVVEGAWDGIVSIWCHLPSALRRKVHAACVKGLRPGGVFLLEAYTPAQLKHATGGPKDVDMLPTLEVLRGELSGLEVEVGVERERDIREGKLHEGTSAVVQVVARKR